MRLSIILALLLISLHVTGQESPHFSSLRLLPSSPKEVKKQKRLTFYPGTYIDTEMLYTDSMGMVVIIHSVLTGI